MQTVKYFPVFADFTNSLINERPFINSCQNNTNLLQFMHKLTT